MRFYWPISKVDAERRMVFGYASTEALDDQGETIKRDAIATALSDYMKFANIREMHQPSAVGVAKEATIDDRGLYLAAKIIDNDAWEKVIEGVYKGFSIGGRVTDRDKEDRSVITGLTLSEISIVDRPANPEAVFDCWKSADAMSADGMVEAAAADAQGAVDAALAAIEKGEPVATEAAQKSADPAPAAGVDDAPPVRKSLSDVGPIANLIPELDWLAEKLDAEAMSEGDGSPLGERMRGIVAELCDFLRAMVAEETAEIVNGTEGGADDMAVIAMAAGIADMNKAGARNSKADMNRIQQMHDLCGEMGAKCAKEAAAGINDNPNNDEDKEATVNPDDLAKAVAGQIGDALAPLVGRIEEIARDVAVIKETPLPPQTIARPEGLASVSKGQDGAEARKALDDEIAKRLADMSQTDRAMVLIRASRLMPDASLTRRFGGTSPEIREAQGG